MTTKNQDRYINNKKDINIYSLNEIEQILQVTRRTIYNWIKEDKLKAFKIGKEWRVTQEALDDFFTTGTK